MSGEPLESLQQRSHPLRAELAAEIHARSPIPLKSPARVLHVTVQAEPTELAAQNQHVLRLLAEFDQPLDLAAAKHLVLPVDDGVTLVWERRTEFVTCSLYFEGGETASAPAAVRDWLSGIPGKLMTAAEVIIRSTAEPPPDDAALASLFHGATLAAARVASNSATVWTDFLNDQRGLVTILIQDSGLNPGQLGRLVQRLLDIESYRIMLLLALPLAHRVAPQITRLEEHLGKLAARMTDVEGVSEQTLLREIAGIAAEVEALAVETPYRFGAARAYHALVLRRLAEFREDRVPGLPTLAEFLERRLSPALQTCVTMQDRIEGLSRRAARMANLLRARVDVALERQNVELLDAMNRRSHLQLRLQETVEGLSVAAITYYAVGLVGYAAQALHAVGVPVNKEVAIGLAIPVVGGFVWLGLRRLRRSLRKNGLP